MESDECSHLKMCVLPIYPIFSTFVKLMLKIIKNPKILNHRKFIHATAVQIHISTIPCEYISFILRRSEKSV